MKQVVNVYFVDRKKIEEYLRYMNACLDVFSSESFDTGSMKDRLSLERIGHMVIESMLDVGNKMIDGFIMRDPGSYEDIIEILEDEKVVPSKDAYYLKQVISLRKNLVQTYIEVDHDHVRKVLNESLDSLTSFQGQVRTYLTEELGPVSAFLPDHDPS